MADAPFEITEEQAWEQIAEWIEAGCSVLWDKRYLAYWTLYLTPPGTQFPLEVSSRDRDDLRIVDCVMRMRRMLAAQE